VCVGRARGAGGVRRVVVGGARVVHGGAGLVARAAGRVGIALDLIAPGACVTGGRSSRARTRRVRRRRHYETPAPPQRVDECPCDDGVHAQEGQVR